MKKVTRQEIRELLGFENEVLESAIYTIMCKEIENDSIPRDNGGLGCASDYRWYTFTRWIGFANDPETTVDEFDDCYNIHCEDAYDDEFGNSTGFIDTQIIKRNKDSIFGYFFYKTVRNIRDNTK